ncbi:MAG: FadR/GntR family transcriptional regulator [Gammaproteobacteria bacterium]
MDRAKKKSKSLGARNPAPRRAGTKPGSAATSPSPHARLYQELAHTLSSAIAAGVYKEGDRLPAERELAIQYKVSRPTVREAVIALEVRGLVEVRVGSGAYVRRAHPSQDAPGFNVTAFELTEARLLFEGEAAALAATLITDEELDRLDELVREIDRENVTAGGGERADHDFHMLIARATRNEAVANTIEDLWRLRSTSPECALLLAKARTAEVKPVVEEHSRIASALRSRDPARARAAMRGHLGAVMEHLLFTTEEHAVEEARRALQGTKARYRRPAAT